MRDVQPLHPLLSRTHPSEPLRPVRPPHESARTLRPVDLMRRLREIDSGKMKVEFEEEAM